MRPGTGHRQPDRQTVAIGDDHHLGALADFGRTDCAPPLFAGTKLPSRKACGHSRRPWASSWLNSARQICSQVPSRDHALNRRPHVAGAPYARGPSSQGPPVFSPKRRPLSVRRSSLRLRPGPGFCCGMKGAMLVHCASVRSCRLMPTMYRRWSVRESPPRMWTFYVAKYRSREAGNRHNLPAYGERGAYGGLRLHETEEQSGRGHAVEAERERSGRSPPGMRRRHPRGSSGGGLPRLGSGGAPLISPSAEPGSRSTARSPSDTMPTACPRRPPASGEWHGCA